MTMIMLRRPLCFAAIILLLAVTISGCFGGGTPNGSQQASYTVSGKVIQKGTDQGVQGVTLVFSGGFGTATTDANGNWSKAGLKGSVTITPAKDKWRFEPGSRQVIAASTGVDFIGVPNAPEYTLTINVTGQGSVAKDPDLAKYVEGSAVELTAIGEAGWVFSHWGGDLSGGNNPQTVVMSKDKTITATFVKLQYNLTVNVTGQGTVTEEIVSTPSAKGTYDDNTVVRLNAIPETGWRFVEWRGDLTGSKNPSTITMNGPKNVTAVFEQLRYLVNTAVIGSGSITKDPDQADYAHGSSVTLTAVPETGWRFDHWEGALSGKANPASLTVDGAKSVTAVFAPLDYFGLEVGNTWTYHAVYVTRENGGTPTRHDEYHTMTVLSQDDQGTRIVFKIGLDDNTAGYYWSKEGDAYYDVGRWQVGQPDTWFFDVPFLQVRNPVHLGDQGFGNYIAVRRETIQVGAGTFDTWVFHGRDNFGEWQEGDVWFSPFVGFVRACQEGEYTLTDAQGTVLVYHLSTVELTSFRRGAARSTVKSAGKGKDLIKAPWWPFNRHLTIAQDAK